MNAQLRETLSRALKEQERLYRAGEHLALVRTIYLCGNLKIPLSPWAVRAWGRACVKIETRKIGSWDEVLGNKPPKPKTAKDRERSESARDRQRRARIRVLEVRQAAFYSRHARINGDREGSFFYLVAQRLGIKPAAARKLYYKHKVHKDIRR